jgi:hypothetical protein
MIRRLLLLSGLLFAAVTPAAFAPAAHAQTYNNSVTVDVAFPGGSVKVSVCCFAPGTPVSITVNVNAGTAPTTSAVSAFGAAVDSVQATAADDGTAVLDYSIPADVAPGPLPLTISGIPAAGSATPAVQQAVIPVQAMAPAAPAVPQQVVLPVSPAQAAVGQAAATTTTTTPSAATQAAQGATTGAALPVTGNELAERLSLVSVLLLAAGAAVLLVRRRISGTGSTTS